MRGPGALQFRPGPTISIRLVIQIRGDDSRRKPRKTTTPDDRASAHLTPAQSLDPCQRLVGNDLAGSRHQVESRLRGPDPDTHVVGGVHAADAERQSPDE